jgi:acyl-CoA synthetase (AMP-forming)/AMP-acid ligase II
VVHLDRLPGPFFRPSTLVELVRHRASCQPKDTAFTYLIDGENQQVHLTYDELDRQARAIGAWLESLGLAGERALLLYPPGLEFIAGFLGCLYAGVVAVPVYPPRRNRSLVRIQAIADDAQAKVALTTDAVLNRIEAWIDETPHLKQLAWLDTCHVPEGMSQWWRMPDIRGDTLAFLQYTSGSTGTPKGVMLNHTNLVHNSALISHAFEHARAGTGGVFWLPSYHDMGLIGGILQPLYIGRPNVLMSPMTFLQKPYRWLSAITRFGPSTSGGPNFAYELCVRKITPEQRKTLDLSTWRVAFNGAEPVRAETLDRFAETFGPCGFRREAFYPCYGLAEATLIVSGGYMTEAPVIRRFDAAALCRDEVLERPAGADAVRNLVGCGGSLPDQRIVIADPETGAIAPAGRIGEIWVRGPSVAQGYWQQPETTEATFRACLEDTGDGPFLRTGDLGFVQNGELFVTGRLKDLIIVRGVNYYPQDIEVTSQNSHPRLRPDSGAAFTVEKDGGELLVLVHEIERHKQGNLDAVFQAVRRAVVAEYDLNVDVIVLIRAGSVPKTSSGKIQRHACRRGYLEDTLDVVGQWAAQDMPQSATATPSDAAADQGARQPVTDEGRRPGRSPVRRESPGRTEAVTSEA